MRQCECNSFLDHHTLSALDEARLVYFSGQRLFLPLPPFWPSCTDALSHTCAFRSTFSKDRAIYTIFQESLKVPREPPFQSFHRLLHPHRTFFPFGQGQRTPIIGDPLSCAVAFFSFSCGSDLVWYMYNFFQFFPMPPPLRSRARS